MVEQTSTHGFWPSVYEPLRTLGHRIADFFAPPSEAASDSDGYQITLELPGVRQDDIDISLHDKVLTVKGEKRSQREETTGSVYFCERQYGRFQRTFRLPEDADGAEVKASFDHGVLTLDVPRQRKAASNARQIKIG
jgi:HSP20 family protein